MSIPGEWGVATATALAVVAILGIGAVGVPAGYDVQAGPDTMPDDALYGLERAGERIRDAVTNRPTDADLAEERLDEFSEMASKGRASEHLDILDDAQDRVMKSVGEEESLETAKKRIRYHIGVLENLENVVPENALPGLEQAIESSSKVEEVLENAPPWHYSENYRHIVENIREERSPISPPGPP